MYYSVRPGQVATYLRYETPSLVKLALPSHCRQSNCDGAHTIGSKLQVQCDWAGQKSAFLRVSLINVQSARRGRTFEGSVRVAADLPMVGATERVHRTDVQLRAERQYQGRR